jgi:NAD(P)-dependent dehydrogenase (short-subunit alcohol dehydrogenase family)
MVVAERLRDTVALVAGGGGEIGAAIAQRLAREGAKVVVADLAPARARACADAIAAAGGAATAIACDVADAASAQAAVAQAAAAFGRLTGLVNVAAAVTPNGTVETLSLADWNAALAVNLTGAFLMCKYAVPQIRAAGGGTIINIASQLGHLGVPERAHYCATKAALLHLTRVLAIDHAKDRIRANTISPGAIDTERSSAKYGGREKAAKIHGPKHLLGRTGRVDEVAAAAAYLASEDASFVTGADILVDGGYVAFKGTVDENLRVRA